MKKTQKRKIVVNGTAYEWCLRGNKIWRDTDHITIYSPTSTGAPIYLDPYPWGLEIRPRTIADAIKFALKNGWEPEKKGRPFRIGYLHDTFVVLPDGSKNSYEYETQHEK